MLNHKSLFEQIKWKQTLKQVTCMSGRRPPAPLLVPPRQEPLHRPGQTARSHPPPRGGEERGEGGGGRQAWGGGEDRGRGRCLCAW